MRLVDYANGWDPRMLRRWLHYLRMLLPGRPSESRDLSLPRSNSRSGSMRVRKRNQVEVHADVAPYDRYVPSAVPGPRGPYLRGGQDYGARKHELCNPSSFASGVIVAIPYPTRRWP